MADTLTFELVSPEKLILSKQVALVTVPGGEGDYGVLPEHAPMITTVRPGVIETFAQQNGPATDRIFVAGGFAEVTPAGCTVLADEATPVDQLDLLKIEDDVKAVAAKLATATGVERAALELQQNLLSAKLAAALAA
jgi:F-type H+-transporting ATPase subunit epsilon